MEKVIRRTSPLNKLLAIRIMKTIDTTPCYFIPENEVPAGFVYPEEYRTYVSGNVQDITPWHFMYVGLIKTINTGLASRYPQRKLVPFAKRQDNDDTACFDAAINSGNSKVLIIHDFASPGWELNEELPSFKEWLKLASEDANEWE